LENKLEPVLSPYAVHDIVVQTVRPKVITSMISLTMTLKTESTKQAPSR
jgi:hypothetical protein